MHFRAKHFRMRIVAALFCMLFFAGPVLAFDPRDGGLSADEGGNETALEALKQGARAYYAGDKALALDSLQAAAASGHPAAQWKLGRMYAEGDGVEENDLKAFEYFNQIVAAHGDDAPSSPQAPYVASAFVQIASYYMTGIAGSEVTPDAARAREIFTYAASYFGDSVAQTELGRMYLEGIGGARDPRQAARWFLLAARKGQLEAQVQLGEMLTSGEAIDPNLAHGLMWLTVALMRAQEEASLLEKIHKAHEEAFALASEDERQRAIALAEQWMAENTELLAIAAQ